MLARIRKSLDERDEGFTLIELLVVMIIIGILAAIAIPVFMNQRKKAVDTSAKADVSAIGKEVAAFLVDSSTLPVLTPGAAAGDDVTVDDVTINVSDSTAAGALEGTANRWCVSVTNADGKQAVIGYQFSSDRGLEPAPAAGGCDGYAAA